MYTIIFENAGGQEQVIFTWNGLEAALTAEYLNRAGYHAELITPQGRN